jgi:hypothetical protein
MHLNVRNRWRVVISYTYRSLYPLGNSPRYPLDSRMGGPQSRSEHGREQRNLLLLPRIEPKLFDRAVSSLDTVLTELQV